MKNTKMNQIVLGGFVAGLVLLTACKKDTPEPETTPDNPTTTVALPEENVTTYDGELSYTPESGTPVLTDDATATLSKSGSTYTLSFSDGVPSLSGLKFQNEDGGYGTISGDGSLTGIAVNGSSLDVGVLKDGNNWSFSGNY